MEHLAAVELELLAVFQAVEEPVSVRGLDGKPRGSRRAHAGRGSNVALVAGQSEKWVEVGAETVRGSQIQSVIALADVERAAIHRDALDHIRDINVRIGVAVAVSIGR